MLKSYTFTSSKNGKNLLVLGAVHGNEICGTKASENIMNKINNGEIKIKTGSVTFIPICNPVAYKNNARYHETNLNRVVKKHSNPVLYEEKLANELTDYIEKADYLLDLHSMHTNGNPFVFQDYEGDKRKNFANIQELNYVFIGWPEIYSATNDYATETYAYGVNTVAVTVECGSHNSKNSVEVAEKCILNSLNHLNIIEGKNCISKSHSPTFIKMEKVVYKESDGDLVSNMEHLNIIKKGEILAKYDDGQEIIAQDDYFIILPNYDCKIGEEWFYLGKKSN